MSLELPTFPRRVKVYELDQDEWVDKGTGYCSGELSGNNEAHIVVRNEEDREDVLLNSHVCGDIQYQKQQETLIVWAEPGKADVALSFQESEGCSLVCDFLVFVQAHIEHGISLYAVATGDGDSEVTEFIAGPLTYPPEPKLGNLAEVVEALTVVAVSQYGRDSIVKYIHETGFVGKLMPVFQTAEELESISDLHELCKIVKILFLLNDNIIFEILLSDENIMGVVGMLEYDPELPGLKANHRDYLTDETRFNEVVPIPDDRIRVKIKETYRLQFLKDVILVRLLDDATFTFLTSMIFMNQIEIVGQLQGNRQFLDSLFSMFDGSDDAKKRDGVRLVHQMASIAKQFQPGQRQSLYVSLLDSGLVKLLEYAFSASSAPNIRILGTEVLVAIIDHDPALLTGQFEHTHKPQEGESKKRFSSRIAGILIDLLLEPKDAALKPQVTESLKVLIDSSTMNALNGSLLGGASSKLSELIANRSGNEVDTFQYIRDFYEQSADKLFAPLVALARDPQQENFGDPTTRSIYEQVCELLSFCIRKHESTARDFIVSRRLWLGVKRIIEMPHKQMRLAGVRTLKYGILAEEERYVDEFIAHDVLDALLNVMISVGNRNNLTHSACLEIFSVIDTGLGDVNASTTSITSVDRGRRLMRMLLSRLMESHRDKLEKLDYATPISALLQKYTQNMGSSSISANLSSVHTDIDTSAEIANVSNDMFGDDDHDNFFNIAYETTTTINDQYTPATAATAKNDEHSVSVVSLKRTPSISNNNNHDVSNGSGLKRTQSVDRPDDAEDYRGPRRRRTSENFADEYAAVGGSSIPAAKMHSESEKKKQAPVEEEGDTDDDVSDDNNDSGDNSPAIPPQPATSDSKVKKKQSFKQTISSAGKKLSLKFGRSSSSI